MTSLITSKLLKSEWGKLLKFEWGELLKFEWVFGLGSMSVPETHAFSELPCSIIKLYLYLPG